MLGVIIAGYLMMAIVSLLLIMMCCVLCLRGKVRRSGYYSGVKSMMIGKSDAVRDIARGFSVKFHEDDYLNC